MSLLFLRKQEVLEIHARSIEDFGGSHGLRDKGALESALAAVENRVHYENADLTMCAATYAFHLTQAHAFIDGNKRIGAAVAEIFLQINGAELKATNEEVVELIMGIAASRITRDGVEAWFRQRVEVNE